MLLFAIIPILNTRVIILIPKKNWEIDLKHLESLIDEKTQAIIANNPSNPCGSIFSKEHMKEILDLCYKHRLPLICDEVYTHMVFGGDGEEFFSFHEVSEKVPVIIVGGLAKRFLVPGWRLGWALISDRGGALKEFRKGVFNLAQLILGPNSVVQATLPFMLDSNNMELQKFFTEVNTKIGTCASIFVEGFQKIKGLKVIVPKGAMYMMVKIELEMFENIKDDFDFVVKLLAEESLAILPGNIFTYPGFFRVVLCVNRQVSEEVVQRMASFCERHLKRS